MVADYWWLILLAAFVVVIGLFLLIRRGGSGNDTLDRHDRAAAVESEPETSTTVEPSVLVIPTAAPFDVAPPSLPVTDDVRVVVEEAPPPVESRDLGPPDDLTVMKGIGPKLAALLADLGVNRYAQIAAWTEADLARVDDRLGAFKGRPVRDRWVEQARLLSGEDRGAFERTFGKIDPTV